MSLGDFLTGVGDVIQTGIQTLPAIIAAGQQQPQVQVPQFPALPVGPQQLGQLGQGTVSGVTTGGCGQFVPTRSRMRAVRELRAVNPSNGKIESWTHRGSPIVWSGDRAIARSYAKAAGFTLKRRGSCARRSPVRRRR